MTWLPRGLNEFLAVIITCAATVSWLVLFFSR